MYREPVDSMADATLYDIPCKLLLSVIQRHGDIEHGRKMVIKRKNDVTGLDNLQSVVDKRRRKLNVTTTKEKPSKSKPIPSSSK